MASPSKFPEEPRPAGDQWWDEVLAGEVAARHPMYGEDVRVALSNGRIVLSGVVPTRRDREQLVHEARARIGSGVRHVDASRLKVRPKAERPGILTQTLVAAYHHRDVADLALRYVLEHSRMKPLRAEVIDTRKGLSDVLPPEVVDAARRQLENGQTLVVVEVDETDAFRVRSLLEQDAHSRWTVTAPPRLMSGGKA